MNITFEEFKSALDRNDTAMIDAFLGDLANLRPIEFRQHTLIELIKRGMANRIKKCAYFRDHYGYGLNDILSQLISNYAPDEHVHILVHELDVEVNIYDAIAADRLNMFQSYSDKNDDDAHLSYAYRCGSENIINWLDEIYGRKVADEGEEIYDSNKSRRWC